jgi:23S rRNA (pseudouridine1915-N3)-methyltransferase
MFKVKVLTIGKCKETWLASALLEYEKRLFGKLSVEWHFAKDDAQLIEWCLAEPCIALHPKGKLLDSVQWSKKMMQLGSRLTFCIGGAEGLPEQILKHSYFLWSLSPLTFTHQMTRLILLEQLYRAIEIEKGSRYHK